MPQTELLQKVIISLAIGALIGIERETSQRVRRELIAGIRTFSLICLLGLLSGYFSDILNTNVFSITAFILVTIISVSGYFVKVKIAGTTGLTTHIAFILTFLLGLLNYYEVYPYFFTVSLGILIAFILVIKEYTRRFARGLMIGEVRDALILGLLTFVILPILPNYPVDPLGALNPRFIWTSVILILSLSFAAYVAMRIVGMEKGIAITGLLGGFISSTGVTVSLSSKFRENKNVLRSATFGIVVASSTMFLRQLIITSFFNTELSSTLLFPLLFLTLGGYLLSFLRWKRIGKRKVAKIEIGSPLSFKPAFMFGLFISVVLLLTKIAQSLGSYAIFFLAFLTGLIGIDAITISLATLSLTTLETQVAITGILLASISNTFSKWVLSYWVGGKELSKNVGKALLVLIFLGTLILLYSL